jgi:hypothetical protein
VCGDGLRTHRLGVGPCGLEVHQVRVPAQLLAGGLREGHLLLGDCCELRQCRPSGRIQIQGIRVDSCLIEPAVWLFSDQDHFLVLTVPGVEREVLVNA